jgi:uncharacterized membrane protein
VGVTRGWRSALIGAAAGVVVLGLLVALFGPSLTSVPLSRLQLVIGILLLLFGMRWLRKAILRAAGVIGLHDETAIYTKETDLLRSAGPMPRARSLDRLAVATAFKAVLLEGLEVIFIVLATGAGGMLLPAAAGALAAGVLVGGLGIIVRHPLARVPENALKFSVGVLLSAFGVFWVGEGLGIPWPGADVALVALIAGFAFVGFAGIALARPASPAMQRHGRSE